MHLFNFNLFSKKASAAPQPLEARADLAINGREHAVNYTRDRSFLYVPSTEDSINPPASTRRDILRITRYLCNNFPLCERALTVSENYAVGNGLIADATTQDAAYNEAATLAFDNWANSVFCSYNHSLTFYQMQRLLVRELITAGEAFLVMLKADNGYPQLMLVKSEDVRHSGAKEDKSIDGISYDAFGKAVEYTIFTGPNSFVKVGAADVIHLMRYKNAGQLRGTSAFETGLNSARDIKDLFQTEKKAVKVHSSLAVASTRMPGNESASPYSDLGAAAPNLNKPTQGLDRAFPGANVILGEGEKIELLSSDRSTAGWHNFIEALMRDVCLALSLPYEVLINADKLSGAGIRFVIADAANYISSLQTLLIDSCIRRVYVWVTSTFVKLGRLPAPAAGSNQFAVSFVTPPSITVDASRVSNAEISLLQNGLLTYASYYSARGREWKEEIRQRIEEEKFLDELARESGIDINRIKTLSAGAATIAPSDPAKEEPAPASGPADKNAS